MKRFALTLDLKDDPDLIKEYDKYHKNVWPEVLKSITDSGIMEMEIYRLETQLLMLIHANADFSFEKKAKMDKDNDRVQEWEELMWKYQQQIPGSAKGEKWVLLKNILE